MSTQNPQSMIKKLVPTWKFLKQTSPEKYGTGPVGLLKNFWGECSEVALATGLGIFSLTGIYLFFLEDNKTGYSSNRAYKDHYTVYRPDDPRIARIKEEWCEGGAPPMTSTRA